MLGAATGKRGTYRLPPAGMTVLDRQFARFNSSTLEFVLIEMLKRVSPDLIR
jgi:hypothetical protein